MLASYLGELFETSSSPSSVPGELEEEDYDSENKSHIQKRKKAQAQALPFYEIVPSKQRNHLLLKAGCFKYYHNRTIKTVKYFACRNKKFPHKCAGSGKLDLETDTFYAITSHTCPDASNEG